MLAMTPVGSTGPEGFVPRPQLLLDMLSDQCQHHCTDTYWTIGSTGAFVISLLNRRVNSAMHRHLLSVDPVLQCFLALYRSCNS